jgi:glucose-1-phosphate thymidylyltransferase
VALINATVGPNVSLGRTHVIGVLLKQLSSNACTLSNANLDNAMMNHVTFNGDFTSISIGDYSVLE